MSIHQVNVDSELVPVQSLRILRQTIHETACLGPVDFENFKERLQAEDSCLPLTACELGEGMVSGWS